jgi:hypothetical protein
VLPETSIGNTLTAMALIVTKKVPRQRQMFCKSRKVCFIFDVASRIQSLIFILWDRPATKPLKAIPVGQAMGGEEEVEGI